MKKPIPSLFILLLLVIDLISGMARADVLLLVHGFLGDANSWERSGVNTILDGNGWRRAGLFVGTPAGPQLFERDFGDATNKVYVANLPSEAPLIVQAEILNEMLDQLSARFPGEAMIVAGHSAGGLVARAAIVKQPRDNLKALITIASPHLGTWRAGQALDITRSQGPFELVKRFIGGNDYVALKHSRALMIDLLPGATSNFTHWLNLQPHPDIRYVSVVRTNPAGLPGDDLVPGYSQDMNNVPALHGRSEVVYTPTGHYLKAADAFTLLDILNPPARKPGKATESKKDQEPS